MATCESRKIDSNITGLAFAEEECLLQLPTPSVPAVAASGTITLSANPTEGESVTVGGTAITFVDAAPGANEVLIGADATATAAALAIVITSLPSVNATSAAGVVTVTAAMAGAAGNAITLAEAGADIAVSGATLTGGTDQSDDGAVWYGQEPNSYTDFGGELTTVARSPIDPSRQNKKGTPTDLDASGGYNQDFTKTNFTRILQGFFFADARQEAATQPLNGPQIDITSVTGAGVYNTSGNANFSAGSLAFASGFPSPANNGLKNVTAAGAGSITVTQPTTVDAAPPETAKLQTVGRAFAAGDMAVVMDGNIATLQLTAANWTDYPTQFFPGKWIFLGGDDVNSRFANNRGMARIGSITAKVLRLDDVSWVPTAEAGAGKSIHVYTGTVIKNEKDPNLIKRRSYNIERTLGMGPNGMQAQYLEGAVANEFTLNIPQAEKLNADVTFVACNDVQRTGDPGDEMKPGKRVNSPNEDAYNTSSNVYRVKLSLNDPTSSTPEALFGYMTEANININNGVTPNKAVGVFGAFDTSAGNFVVSGSLTVYFTTVEAIRAVRNNADAALSFIAASGNGGFVFDIPLLSLGGGRANVEKDQPITLPLTPNGAENALGYTMLYEQFDYLPNIAMP